MTDEIMPIISNTESIKLCKMSKGYNWEIKIFIKDEDDKAVLDRIKKLNTELQNEYGND